MPSHFDVYRKGVFVILLALKQDKSDGLFAYSKRFYARTTFPSFPKVDSPPSLPFWNGIVLSARPP